MASEDQQTKTYTAADVAAHASDESGYWLIVDGGVYDVTAFIDEHPGGPKILRRAAGKDASRPFWKYHGKAVLERYGAKLRVGDLRESAKL